MEGEWSRAKTTPARQDSVILCVCGGRLLTTCSCSNIIVFCFVSSSTPQRIHYTLSLKQLQNLKTAYENWAINGRGDVGASNKKKKARGRLSNTSIGAERTQKAIAAKLAFQEYGPDKSHNTGQGGIKEAVTVYNKWTKEWTPEIEKLWRSVEFDVIEVDCRKVGKDLYRTNSQIATGHKGTRNCTYAHPVIGIMRVPTPDAVTMAYKTLYEVGTLLATLLLLPFAQPGFTDGKPREQLRRSEFAHQVSPLNIWEAATVACLFGLAMTCSPHIDEFNCKEQHQVMTVSRVRIGSNNKGEPELVRATAIFYQKKAATDFLRRVDGFFEPLMQMDRFHKSLPLHRQGLGDEWRQPWYDRLGEDGVMIFSGGPDHKTVYGAALCMRCGMAKDDLYCWSFAEQFLRMQAKGVEMNELDVAQIAVMVAWGNAPFTLCSLLNRMGTAGTLPEVDYRSECGRNPSIYVCYHTRAPS